MEKHESDTFKSKLRKALLVGILGWIVIAHFRLFVPDHHYGSRFYPLNELIFWGFWPVGILLYRLDIKKYGKGEMR